MFFPVFLPGESHGQWSLAGYSPKGCRVRHDWATNAYTHSLMWLHSFTCPPAAAKSSYFPVFSVIRPKKFCQPTSYEMVPHWCFNFYFPKYCWSWIFLFIGDFFSRGCRAGVFKLLESDGCDGDVPRLGVLIASSLICIFKLFWLEVSLHSSVHFLYQVSERIIK